LLLNQLGRPASLLDADVQVPARLGDLIRLGPQVRDPDGGHLLQLAAQLTRPGHPGRTSPGVGDGRHQLVLGRVRVPEREGVGKRKGTV